ncbi:MAG: hypothetical protein WAV09_03850 [Minisyncoccia bacterium]
MTRTLSIAALILLAATSFTFAISDNGYETREVRKNTFTNTKKVETTLNVQCIQNAVEKRDSAIIVAHGAFNTSIVNALTVRKDALKAAWAKPTRQERTSGRKAAYDVFRTSQKSAHETLRSVRKTSWSTFDTDMKACGVSKEAHGERASEVKEPTSSL